MYQNVDEQIDAFIKKSLNKPIVPYSKYRGFAEAGLFGLLYLLKRNEQECVVLSNFKDLARRILEERNSDISTIPYLKWSDIGFVYYWDKDSNDYALKVPGAEIDLFRKGVRTCMACLNTRFIISLLTMKHKNKSVHANIVLYDSISHTIERFDPYETAVEGMHNLDPALLYTFASVDSKVQLIPLANLSFFNGWQYKQEQERERHALDPIGLCQPHTILYADTRMSFPNQDPRSIPRIFERAAKQNNISLTVFGRNYAEHLRDTLETIFRKYNAKLHADFEDARVPILAIILDQLALYKTVFT